MVLRLVADADRRLAAAAAAGATDGDGAGNERVDRWYAGVGRAFHEEGRQPTGRRCSASCSASSGWAPTCSTQAIADPTTPDEVRADHDLVVATYGAFGVPTIVFPDPRPDAAADDRSPSTSSSCRHHPVTRRWSCSTCSCAYNRFPTMFEMRHPKRPSDIGSWPRLLALPDGPRLEHHRERSAVNERAVNEAP